MLWSISRSTKTNNPEAIPHFVFFFINDSSSSLTPQKV